MNTQQDFAVIKSQTNFEALALQILSHNYVKHRGDEIRAHCPIKIHKKNKEGFSINRLTGIWFCFSCDEGGDIIKLAEKVNNISTKDAAKFLKEQNGNANIIHQPTQEKSYTDQEVIDCWENASCQGNDTYFLHRNLTPPPSAKFGKNPKGFYSTLINVQNIQGNFKGFICLGSEKKFNYFIQDDAVKFMLLGELKEEGDIFIGEGIATVQTVWEAFDRKITSIAVGSWANVNHVLDEITTVYPNLKIVVLLDSDKEDKLENIRTSYPNSICLLPKFQSNKMNLKDFNDIISKENLPLTEVRDQIEIAKRDQIENGIVQAQSIMIKPTTEIELFEKSLIDQDNIEDNIQTADQLINDQDARRMLYQGKEFMGLPQRTLPKLDDLLSGLRKFIVLAAAPNVGKTAMSIQLVVDVIQKNDDACAIFMSLEMSRNDIMDRIRCYLAGITWKQLYFGKLNSNDKGFYTREEQKQLDESKKILQTIGNRILILDDKCCKDISALTIKTKIEQLKKKSRCEKAIVVIDYLQVFPVSETELLKLRTENDIDRHRISQIIMLRDILQDDPLIVIAEARKPSGGEKAWGVSMADILGSSRTAYACDAGMLLNQISDDELSKELGISKDDCSDVRDQLKQKGQTIVKLTIDKARDGMQKGNILIMFHFLQNKFEEVSWMDIKTRITIDQKKEQKNNSTKHNKNQYGALWNENNE